jgi:hypothetical protein
VRATAVSARPRSSCAAPAATQRTPHFAHAAAVHEVLHRAQAAHVARKHGRRHRRRGRGAHLTPDDLGAYPGGNMAHGELVFLAKNRRDGLQTRPLRAYSGRRAVRGSRGWRLVRRASKSGRQGRHRSAWRAHGRPPGRPLRALRLHAVAPLAAGAGLGARAVQRVRHAVAHPAVRTLLWRGDRVRRFAVRCSCASRAAPRHPAARWMATCRWPSAVRGASLARAGPCSPGGRGAAFSPPKLTACSAPAPQASRRPPARARGRRLL